MSLQALLYNFYRRMAYVGPFIRATKEPIKAQEKVLRCIVRKNKGTEFGKDHNFAAVRTIADYQRTVPLQSYEKLHGYIEKVKQGRKAVLTKDEAVFFATTSGTMGSPKFIPATQYTIQQYARNFQIFFYFACREHPKMFDKHVLSITSRAIKGKTAGGIAYGSISGLVYTTEPFFVQQLYAVPHEVFAIEDYDARYYCIVRFAIEKEISFIITPNPSTILHLCEIAMKQQAQIIDDIQQGSITDNVKIEPLLRQKLLQHLKRNPERAEFLQNLARQKKFLPMNYWPGLQLIVCWKEGTLGHYMSQLKRYFPETPVRDLGLIASEAHCSIPISDTMNAGVLAVDTNFYEFIDIATGNIHTVGELKQGCQYSLVLTTHAGLYRYHIKDIVEVVGFYNKTPIIHFIHRGDNVTSITGEKLTEWQVVTAVRHALGKLSIPLHHFTFYAHGAGKGHYDVYLELQDAAGKAADKRILKMFVKELDNQLAKLNIEYKDKRRSGRLAAPQLKLVANGGYRKLHKARSVAHGQDSQIKLPVLTDDKTFKSAMAVIGRMK